MDEAADVRHPGSRGRVQRSAVPERVAGRAVRGRSSERLLGLSLTYPVSAVNGFYPVSLEQFIARDVTTIDVIVDRARRRLRGTTTLLGHVVWLYEQHDGGGADHVRVWSITESNGRYVAVQR